MISVNYVDGKVCCRGSLLWVRGGTEARGGNGKVEGDDDDDGCCC